MPFSLRRSFLRGAAFVLWLAGSQLSAADLALVLANSDYRDLPDVGETRDMRSLAEDLARDGFDVIAAFDRDTRDMIDAAQRFGDRSADADRILVVLSGHVVTTNTDAWLLGADADREADQFTATRTGLSLSALARLAEKASGRAVLLVGPTGRSGALGSGLGAGTRGVTLPQGVTLARGSYSAVRAAVFDGLLVPGTSLDAALKDMSARGFLPKRIGFTPRRGGGSGEAAARAQEEGFWEAARAMDTEAALELYLSRYPQGRFVAEARSRIEALSVDRERELQRAEDRLGLDRDDRRRIQRYLTDLGYNTRGVDGIFGRGTRGAIRAWQAQNGFPETGYLNRRQLTVLLEQGREREREREREEARRDDEYWDRTGARGTIDGLRAYLERYPRGRHAEEARERLAALEEEAEPAGIREAWRRARDADTIEAYQDFIQRYPDTPTAEIARERIRELRQDENDERIKRAQREEREMLKNPITRLLVEQRLTQLGYRPGVPDGQFDDRTRAALRKFQRDRNLFESGYVTKRTAAFLLAGR